MTEAAGEDTGAAFGAPFIQALLAARVPVDQILGQAEALGADPGTLRELAGRLVPPCYNGSTLASRVLALAATRDWLPFLPAVLDGGVELFEGLLRSPASALYPLERLLDEGAWDRLSAAALARLGHPARLRGTGPEAVPWLDRDLGLVQDCLELRGFATRARAWRKVLVDALALRDGAGPRVLGHAVGRWSRPVAPRATRLFRVDRLRALEDLQHLGILVAVDCPDLERLDATPPVLVLRGCPGVRELQPGAVSRLLHVEDCPRLRSIGAGKVWDDPFPEVIVPTHHTVVLRGCSALRELPGRMHVTGDLVLEDLGPIHRWPADLRIGGDLRLRDCRHFEELPPLEVRGCLEVRGASGLRRLAPGTVVGRHLDLRACADLEGIPRGLSVGGALLLPPHLHRAAGGFQAQEPLLEVPVDAYPALRTLLLGLGFPGLTRPAERQAAKARAEAALDALRRELRQDPRIESELLWTASEVWRDLAEELYAAEHPWDTGNDADDELPLAWFRGLLLSA